MPILNTYYGKKIDDLITNYKKNPSKIRLSLIFEDNLDIFYHVVFTSDNYYSIIEDNIEDNNYRFMKILIKLPIELQMIIVRRMSELNGFIIEAKLFNANIKKYIEKYIVNYEKLK
jgi:hypothetical protein